MYQDERRLDFHALGREIKRKREAKGWTQEYLAQLVDRTPRSIMYFENRGQHPSLNTFYKIVTLLDISVDQFFYPDKQNEESDCRQHIDRMLNTMDENELTIMEATAEGIQKARETEGSVRNGAASVFPWGFRERTNGKQGKCSHTCYFCIPAGCKNACWGASQTRLWDILSQSNLSASPFAIAPVPFALAVRDTQQMVNVGLDRHGLPHLLLRRAVLGIERLFRAASWRRFSFSSAILGSFSPPSNSPIVALAAR